MAKHKIKNGNNRNYRESLAGIDIYSIWFLTWKSYVVSLVKTISTSLCDGSGRGALKVNSYIKQSANLLHPGYSKNLYRIKLSQSPD